MAIRHRRSPAMPFWKEWGDLALAYFPVPVSSRERVGLETLNLCSLRGADAKDSRSCPIQWQANGSRLRPIDVTWTRPAA